MSALAHPAAILERYLRPATQFRQKFPFHGALIAMSDRLDRMHDGSGGLATRYASAV